MPISLWRSGINRLSVSDEFLVTRNQWRIGCLFLGVRHVVHHVADISLVTLARLVIIDDSLAQSLPEVHRRMVLASVLQLSNYGQSRRARADNEVHKISQGNDHGR